MNRVRMHLLLACIHGVLSAMLIFVVSVAIAGAILVCLYGYYDAEGRRMWGGRDE